MKRRFLPTIIALAALIILGVYANYYEVEKILPPGITKPVQLAKVPAKQIKAIVWEKGTPREIRVERLKDTATGIFKITKPEEFRANDDEISGLLNSFADLKSELTVTALATDSKVYGLASSSPRVTIETASGSKTFVLGALAAVGGSVYFQKEGETAIYLVPRFVGSLFNKTLKDVRARTPFFEDFTEIASIAMRYDKTSIDLERTPSKDWKITSPRNLKGDSSEVSSLIFSMRDLKIDNFVSDQQADVAKYGFDKPTYDLTLYDSKGNHYQLLAGQRKNGLVYVKRASEPYVYSLSEKKFKQLEKSLITLRSKVLPELAREKIDRIELELGSDSVSLARKDGKWMSKGHEIAEKHVSELIDAYYFNHIHSFHTWDQRQALGVGDFNKCDAMKICAGNTFHHIYFGTGDGTDIAVVVDDQKEVVKIPIKTFEAFHKLVTAVNDAVKPAPKPVLASGTPASVQKEPVAASATPATK